MEPYFALIDKYKELNTHTIDFFMTKEYIDLTVTNKKSKKVITRTFQLKQLPEETALFEKTLTGV